MALNVDKTVKNVEVSKTIIEEADTTENPSMNEEEKIIDEAEQFRGLFPDRQSFLSSFLKTLIIETPGNCGYNSHLFICSNHKFFQSRFYNWWHAYATFKARSSSD